MISHFSAWRFPSFVPVLNGWHTVKKLQNLHLHYIYLHRIEYAALYSVQVSGTRKFRTELTNQTARFWSRALTLWFAVGLALTLYTLTPLSIQVSGTSLLSDSIKQLNFEITRRQGQVPRWQMTSLPCSFTIKKLAPPSMSLWILL